MCLGGGGEVGGGAIHRRAIGTVRAPMLAGVVVVLIAAGAIAGALLVEPRTPQGAALAQDELLATVPVEVDHQNRVAESNEGNNARRALLVGVGG